MSSTAASDGRAGRVFAGETGLVQEVADGRGVGERLGEVMVRSSLSDATDALVAEIGAVYDTAGVQTLLGGVSDEVLATRRQAHTIIAMQTSDQRWVYPAFQFAGDDVDPALVPAIRALRGAPAWSAALWFVTPNPDLGAATPVEWVRDGGATDALVVSAGATVREWQ